MQFNPGLRARLTLAFGAVAGLAIAANLLADRTVSIVIERVRDVPVASSAPIATTTARPAPPIVDIPLEIEASDPMPGVVHREELDQAVESYQRAVDSRVVSADAQIQRQLDEATRALERRVRDLQEEIITLPKAQRRAIAQGVEEMQAQGSAAVVLADRRRDAQGEYDAALDNLSSTVREQLDDAWRIFGRVIARQRLVELRDSVEELRRDARKLFEPGAMDDAAVARVEQRETALIKLLPKDAHPGVRTKDDWDSRFRYRVEAAVQVRHQLLDLARQAGDADARRLAQTQTFSRRVAALPERTGPKRAAVAATAPVPAPIAAVEASAAAVAADSAEPLPMATTTREERDDSAARSSRRTLIVVTAAVLLLMLAISVLTLRSLVRQVARLTDGIRRVARGEAATVATGGIRELDVVASEVNILSRELARARAENLDYQHDLEARVAERTAQLQHQAANDPLTNLPNRRELSRLLQTSLVAAAQSGRRVGVFLIDLDNFKVINDGMGHGFGDQVLVAIAARLRELAPQGGFAARLGGDEFTVVAADAEDVDSIRAAGWALVRAFQQPLQVDGRELLLSVSVGASIYPDHEADADSLMRAADSALFRAKAQGRSQLTLFSRDMFDAAQARFTTEQSLRRALERGEFELVYQPEVDVATFEMKSVEALLRWRLPDGRQACPAEFLSVAEESGLITPISDWVLREAVAAAERWYRGGWTDVRVAINVSSRQLVDLAFVPRLRELLEQAGLPPSAIEVELTENVLQTGAHTTRTLELLRELGVPTALDDFGTGYSSLASLEQLPLTRVKLDRSLVASIDTNPRSAAIAQSIVGLCQGLGLAITAEGVERIEQFDLLLRHPSLTLQGFLIARPMPEAEVEAARQGLPRHLESLLLTLNEDALPTAPGPSAEVDAPRRTGYL